DRTIVMMGPAVFDIFTGTGPRTHVWDRTLRFNGDMEINEAVAGEPTPLGGNYGYQHLKVLSRLPAVTGWHGVWQTSKAGAFHAWVGGRDGQEAIRAIGPDKDQIVLIRQTGSQATFGMVYALEKWNTLVKSCVLERDDAAGISALKLVTQAGTTTVF